MTRPFRESAKSCDAATYVQNHRPDKPCLLGRPHKIAQAAQWFLTHFKGKTIYAVKANDAPFVVKTLAQAGIKDFDVASQWEMEHVLNHVPHGVLHFMNPIKSYQSIQRAYFDFNVRHFALDSLDEFEKIMSATNQAKDLSLTIRLACSNVAARLPMVGKFGLRLENAGVLLKKIKHTGNKTGLTFHVGSQAVDPTVFTQMLQRIGGFLIEEETELDLLDLGGGFPAHYTMGDPISLAPFMTAIEKGLRAIRQSADFALYCEPGRALVAEGESLLVQVIARQNQELFINDGAFGCLYDGAHLGWRFPVQRVYRAEHHDVYQEGKQGSDVSLLDFQFWGPTCDTVDHCAGPFTLPSDMAVGDYIEIGHIGAYGRVMRTSFNGMGIYREAMVTDDPFTSIFT